MTEPDAGSDVQSLKTTAVRENDYYILNGSKTFITNAEYGNMFLVLATADSNIKPGAKGINAFVVEKGAPGYTITNTMKKLGYRGLVTPELSFENSEIPVENLVGLEEDKGFYQLMERLEVGEDKRSSTSCRSCMGSF